MSLAAKVAPMALSPAAAAAAPAISSHAPHADLVAARVKEGTGRQLDLLADEVLSGRVTPDQAARTLLAD